MIGQTVSHYKILEKIGEGGMGIVYRAEDTKLLRSVALKFLPPEMTRDLDAKRRFIQEARAASGLDHPNIAVVHEINETADGHSFICMAYYDGQTLKSRLAKAPLSVEEAVRIALQIASGLQRAHESGIVHRDIKPGNIIITLQGEVKIVDFGLAKLSAQTRQSRSQVTAGTAAYMAPEQITGNEADTRSDLFSLGIVLYEAATGRRPFIGEHEPALFYSIVNVNPVPPSTLRHEISPELEQIILRLLEKDPESRYQRAGDLCNDLKRYLGEEQTPRPRKRLFQLPKSRLAIAGGAIVIVAAFLVVWFATSGKAFSLLPTDYVLVAAFDNQTGESEFDHSFSEAMKVSLRQSGQFNLFPNERIFGALERMKRDIDTRLDEPTAIEVARREAVRVVLAGSISHVGSTYFLTCKIIDAVTGEIVRRPSNQLRSPEELYTGIDDICRKIRAELGESLGEISQYSVPLAKVTTQSLDALDLYSRGEIYESQGKYNESAELKAKAVLKDTTFVRAISDLSYIHRRLRHDSLALAYHRRVLPLLNNVTERDRLYILAFYYSQLFECEPDTAIMYAKQLVLLYPNSSEGYGLLAWLAMYRGDVATCLDANDKSVALDTTFAGTSFNNSAFVLALAGRADSAIALFYRSKAKRPDFTAVDEYIARAYWIRMRLDSTSRILQSIDSKKSMASLLCFQGALARSADICQTLLSKAEKPAERAGLYPLLAFIEGSRGNNSASVRYLREGLTKYSATSVEYVLLTTLMARAGKITEAERARKQIDEAKSDDPSARKRKGDYLNLVDGVIDMAQKRLRPAIDHFRQVRRLLAGDATYLLAQRYLADCYSALSDTLALSYYGALLDKKGEVVMPPQLTSLYPPLLWPEAELQMAKFQLSLGRKSEAREHLERLNALWAGADKNHITSREVRQLLAEITH